MSVAPFRLMWWPKLRLSAGIFTGLDVGCADLIRQDKVRVKQGVEIARFTSNTVVFTDGSEVEADVVVFGYALVSLSSPKYDYRKERN